MFDLRVPVLKAAKELKPAYNTAYRLFTLIRKQIVQAKTIYSRENMKAISYRWIYITKKPERYAPAFSKPPGATYSRMELPPYYHRPTAA